MSGEDILEWRGCQVIDADGDRVGKLNEIYLDAQTRRPEWALVGTGLFGRRTTFIPLKDAERQEDYVRVAFQKDQIKDAPDVDPDGQLTQAEEERIYSHYGLDYAWDRSASGLPQQEAGESGQGEAQRAGATEGAGESETEGRASGGAGAGTESGGAGAGSGVQGRPREQLRLTKYVVTEHIPVEREEVRVEREPVSREQDEGGDR